jgi:hypothetical protein
MLAICYSTQVLEDRKLAVENTRRSADYGYVGNTEDKFKEIFVGVRSS